MNRLAKIQILHYSFSSSRFSRCKLLVNQDLNGWPFHLCSGRDVDWNFLPHTTWCREAYFISAPAEMWIETTIGERLRNQVLISSLLRQRCGLKRVCIPLKKQTRWISSLLRQRCGLKRLRLINNSIWTNISSLLRQRCGLKRKP